MHRFFGTNLGKLVRGFTKVRGSGGQALPGLVVERILPNYLQNMLQQLPDGVVVITGTNGKTTTTKMVVELLQANGKRVLTNPTGSNFTRGIISSLTQQAKFTGDLPFDIGVFELDEAYARQFVTQVKPNWVLALNVMRDQLDRFGELDTAAKMIGATMHEAKIGIVVNDDDSRLVDLAKTITGKHGQKLHFFGVKPKLRRFFPIDDELVAVEKLTPKTKTHHRDVELAGFDGQKVTYAFSKKEFSAQLQLSGQHNYQNAAAALTLVNALVKASPEALVAQLATVKPAFGRGEEFVLKDGSKIQLVLVKNPAGFRQALASYPATTSPVMFAVNDNYADGRDVSWLWDVDFMSLAGKKVLLTSGTRAADMALRLQYDDVKVERIEPRIEDALKQFSRQKGDKLIFTTYSAMLQFYKILKKQAGKTL
ncbi:MAG TPA: MurT ligase domain-containing protein [Candidatus Saccharimonadales bacterium]|nr:MurT ligase domain-containing protein [Candidatus Saccharimonadales bacterium]